MQDPAWFIWTLTFTNLFLRLIIFTELLGSYGYLLKQTLSLDSKVDREQKLIKLWRNKTCSKPV